MTGRRGLLFDLDGTLIDSTADIASAANRTLRELGHAERPEAEIRSFIGDGVAKLIERCTDADTTVDLDAAVDRFSEHYAAGFLDQTGFFPGIADLLASLPPPLGILSNKPEAYCVQILRGLGVADRFGLIAGGDTYPESKPSPVPLRAACAALDVDPASSLFVGDGHQDMRAARAAGLTAIGVTWGQATREVLEESGADVVVDDVAQLAAALRRHPNASPSRERGPPGPL
ncbi:MAG: phosphoglycolate phosphatase [Planctomycetes bacterium]|nr:phosphoglycolate phosphatase [Planctomycetota bacterium]